MKTALLSLIIILALAGFSFFQFEKINKENVQLQNALSNIEANLTKLDADASKTKASLNELQGKFSTLKLEENWKISEASHLLRLAVVEIQVSRDVATTLHLLDAADNHLSTIQDPKLLPVRELIAKEKAALQAIQLPDLDKLWLKVGILIDQIPSLPTRGIRKDNEKSQDQNQNPEAKQDLLKNPELSVTMPEATTETATDTSTWKKGLATTWHELKGLIKIQHHDAAIEPVLNESEQALAKENLLLILEQVRWAILHTNNTVYQGSLLEAKQWLNRYFEANDNRTQAMQASLDELAKIDLRPVLPDVGQALQAIQNKG